MGETLGFVFAGSIGVVVTVSGWSMVPTYVVMVFAGAVEGAVLGTAQGRCLVRWNVLAKKRWWIITTSIGAAIAWSLGLLPSAIGGFAWTTPTIVLVAVGAGLMLLVLPVGQYLVLRASAVPHAARWIVINVVAWMLGIAWTLAPSPLVDESSPVPVLLMLYAAAGVAMAATVAVITGTGLLIFIIREAPLSHHNPGLAQTDAG